VNAQRLAPLEEILAELRGEVRETGRAVKPAEPPRRVAPAGQSVSAVTVSSSGTAAAVRMAPVAEPAPPAPRAESSSAPLATPVPRVAERAREVGANGQVSPQVKAIQTALQEHKHKLLWSMAGHATRWEIEGGELRLFFPAEKRSLTEMLPREAMDRLRTVVQQVVGQPMRVCVRLESDRAGVNGDAELRAGFEQDPIVKAMLERFGGRISGVRRPDEE